MTIKIRRNGPVFKIGTLADWFGVGLLDGIRASQQCGASGVQIYAWNELDPRKVTAGQIAQIKSTARACAQEVTALCGELGGHGFEIAADNPEKVDYLKRTVDLALALDCRVITTHIGRVPEDKTSARWANMLSACCEAGAYAAQNGVTIAVETGPEPIPRLIDFLSGCKAGIGVNYDPANLVMVTRDDEVEGVYTAGSAIVHTHAKDGRCNFYAGPEKVYGIFAEGGIEALNTVSTYFSDLPLGQGEVRWDPYLQALADIGYNGYLTIEREVGGNAGADIRLAVRFLKEKLNELGL
nr:sugar phosphate isomerase/epimerase family protein [Anaerotruncus colihominis]